MPGSSIPPVGRAGSAPPPVPRPRSASDPGPARRGARPGAGEAPGAAPPRLQQRAAQAAAGGERPADRKGPGVSAGPATPATQGPGDSALDDLLSAASVTPPAVLAARMRVFCETALQPPTAPARLEQLLEQFTVRSVGLPPDHRIAAMEGLGRGASADGTDTPRLLRLWRELARQAMDVPPAPWRDLARGLCRAAGGSHMPPARRAATLLAIVEAARGGDRPPLPPVAATGAIEALWTELGVTTPAPEAGADPLVEFLQALRGTPALAWPDGTMAALFEGVGLALGLDGEGRVHRAALVDRLLDAAARGLLDPVLLGEAVEGVMTAQGPFDSVADGVPWLLGRVLAAGDALDPPERDALLAVCVRLAGGDALAREDAQALCGRVLQAVPGMVPGLVRDVLAGLARAVVDETTGSFTDPEGGPVPAVHPLEGTLLRQVLASLPALDRASRQWAVRGLVEGFHPQGLSSAARAGLAERLAACLPRLTQEAAYDALAGLLRVPGLAGPAAAGARAALAHELVASTMTQDPREVPGMVQVVVRALGGSAIAEPTLEAVAVTLLQADPPLSVQVMRQAMACLTEGAGGGQCTGERLMALFSAIVQAAPRMPNAGRTAAMAGLCDGLGGSALPEAHLGLLQRCLWALPAATDRALVSQLCEGLALAQRVYQLPARYGVLAGWLRGPREGAAGLRQLDLAAGLDRARHPGETDLAAHRLRVEALIGAPSERAAVAAAVRRIEPERKHRPG